MRQRRFHESHTKVCHVTCSELAAALRYVFLGSMEIYLVIVEYKRHRDILRCMECSEGVSGREHLRM